MSKKFLFLRFWPVEIVLFTYFLVTFILLIFYQSQLPGVQFHITIRGLLLTMLFLLIYLENKNQKGKTYYVIRLFAPLLLLPFLYKETDYFNNLFFTENLDPFFADLEYALFNSQPSLIFSEKFNSDWFSELMYFGYFSYYLLILFIPLYAFYKKGGNLAEKIIFIVITSFLIYYPIFILIPVAGPQFYFIEYINQLPKGYVFGPIMKYIQLNGEGQTGAFPSSHVSICLILLYLCYKELKELLSFVLTVSILLILSTVYIMAHYVIDIIGALLLTPLIYFISNRLYNKFITNSV